MKRLLLFTFLSQIPVIYSLAQNLEEDNATVITNISIITANERGNITTMIGYVAINKDSIVYVGKSKPMIKKGTKTINGKGKFIIPGLIDSHVHIASMAGLNGQLNKKYPELVKPYFEQLPKSFLYFGYTTLIDLNNYAPQIINKIKSSELRPDIYTCGEQVLVMNDFMMEMEEYSPQERYSYPFLHDKYNTSIALPDSVDLNMHTPGKVVSRIVKEQRAICIKMVYEDESTGLLVTWALPGKRILTDLAEEAQKQNIPFILHAPSFESQKLAVETGVKIIAHSMWNWSADTSDFSNTVLSADHKQLLTTIAEKQIGYQPTFRTITAENDLLSATFSSQKNLEHVFPKSFHDLIKSEEGQWGRQKILGRVNYLKKFRPDFYYAAKGNYTTDEEMFSEIYKLYKTKIGIVVKYLADKNANLLFGTDGVAMNMYTNPPGYNGFLEMKHWVDAGIPLNKIFTAATINNANAFNLQHLYGSIEKGKASNLLILRSNPLKSIEAYNDIETVIIGGKVLKRESLSATQLK